MLPKRLPSGYDPKPKMERISSGMSEALLRRQLENVAWVFICWNGFWKIQVGCFDGYTIMAENQRKIGREAFSEFCFFFDFRYGKAQKFEYLERRGKSFNDGELAVARFWDV